MRRCGRDAAVPVSSDHTLARDSYPYPVPTLNSEGIKLTIDTKTGGKGVVRVGCKEVGKQGLNAGA